MKFSDKAIYSTITGLIIYQVVSYYIFIAYPKFQDFFWINQLIFATSTSFGAVFWSLFITRKYEKFANLENLVSKVYDDIDEFRQLLLKHKNLLKNPLINSILSDDDLSEEDQDEKAQEIIKEFKNRQGNDNNE